MAKGAQPHGFIFKTYKSWRAAAGRIIGIQGCARCGVLVHNYTIHAGACTTGPFCPEHVHCAGCGKQAMTRTEEENWRSVEGPGSTWARVCSPACSESYVKEGPTALPVHATKEASDVA